MPQLTKTRRAPGSDRRAAADAVYTLLVEAGAPDIEEPLFYRVREHAHEDDLFVVELRAARPYGGSDICGTRTVGSKPTLDLLGREVSVLELLVAATTSLVEEQEGKQLVAAIKGDHP